MDVASLHLSDEVLELLRSGKINNRLLCEMMTHPRFRQLMADTEIVVDRIADMRIQDMNTVLEAARQKVMKEYAPDEMDVYMRTLEVAQINETDYFSHIIHEDMEDETMDRKDGWKMKQRLHRMALRRDTDQKDETTVLFLRCRSRRRRSQRKRSGQKHVEVQAVA